jgi:acyl carrier protein
MPSREEIYSKVAATIVEALAVDEADVRPDAALQRDLGAESIDMLDIVFRLEKEFGIEIQPLRKLSVWGLSLRFLPCLVAPSGHRGVWRGPFTRRPAAAAPSGRVAIGEPMS